MITLYFRQFLEVIVAKNKLKKFDQIEGFKNLFQYKVNKEKKEVREEVRHLGDYKRIQGKWNETAFNNTNPIVLELACGKGHYTLELARRFPDKNFIGVDIRGERLWQGAKTALEEELTNVAFFRTQIEFIDHFFNQDEVSEIWITFPDPFPKKKHEKKRLTSPIFLELYRKILLKNGIVHLKTDSTSLFNYSVETAVRERLDIEEVIFDVYDHFEGQEDILVDVQTYYEKLFSEKGERIKYMRYKLS